MITNTTYADKNIFVLGLGLTGISVTRALTASGAHVFVWDDDAQKRTKIQGFSFLNPHNIKWKDFNALVLSPGISHTSAHLHPAVKAAKDANIPIIGDMEIFVSQGAKSVGITGTNGKSTTTALVGHILNRTNKICAIGGNIGKPVLSLPSIIRNGFYVLEVSSFQIELAQSLQVDIAVLLNITEDHLDRHETIDNYAKIKSRLFWQQKENAKAIINVNSPICASIAKELEEAGREVIRISTREHLNKGVFIQNNYLIDALGESPVQVFHLGSMKRLKGEHNKENIIAAYTVARTTGVSISETVTAIHSFLGLPHRQEYLIEVKNVQFINDSKATNVDSAITALKTYNNIYWILGGRPKSNKLKNIEKHLGNVKAAYTIGESSQEFAQTLKTHMPDVTMCQKLSLAIDAAFSDAQKTATVSNPATILFSPACLSFDQYKNFEDRGRDFISRIYKLHKQFLPDTV